MRILCCLDGTNIAELSEAITTLVTATERTPGLLYVTDTGPHQEIGRKREGLLRSRLPSGSLGQKMQQAELAAAQDILQEGLRYLPAAKVFTRQGRPEREIVLLAAEWSAELIIICPRSPGYGGPPQGPKSVGHVARFVLDHAPCPVLLVRPRVARTATTAFLNAPPRPKDEL